ncbi:hypothetical protein HMPREF9141_0064 [Prevotella multiformis DSM 16608]|uniref:Uncharacterized protein n=1 Tax=Prevotella multiformis DSM 16608 TaxID=888743 RepID=F0F398_9BACT|nr:hypothetical protein HMPREF9141_0064 [Prevotella multiformis DSM 16608]
MVRMHGTEGFTACNRKENSSKKQPLRIFQTGCLPEGRTLPAAARAGVFFPSHCMYVNKAGSPHELWQYNPPAN